MLEITQIPAPRVPLIDERTGLISMEWFRFFNGLYTVVGQNQNTLQPVNGGTGLSTIPVNGQLLIGNGAGYTLNTLTPGAGIGVTNAAGSITLANTGVLSWSGGLTGLTPAAATTGAVTLAGTLGAGYGGTGLTSYAVGDLLYASGITTLSKLADVATGNALISGGVITAPAWGKIGLTTHVSGTLPVANGGTGQNSYTNGQLLIGNTTGNTLGKATLTAGSGIAITNGPASVTIASDKAYGSFYDTTTQSAAALTIKAITFNSTELSYNVSIGTPTSRFVVARAGIYNIQFSAEISNPSAAIDDVTIWIRQNGVDLANSAGIVGSPPKHGAINGHTIIGWNYILQAAANDYFELYWITDNGTTQILTYPASATPPIHPQAPSMILTVQQV
jgi:hypothetical protein